MIRTKRAATALIALALLGGCNLLRPTTPDAVEKILLADKDGGEMFATLKRTYPQEFYALTKELADRSAQYQSSEAIGKAAKAFMLSAMSRHIGELAQAPHDALAAYRRAELGLLETLRTTGTDQCATYFRTGVIDWPAPPPVVRDAMVNFEIKSWEGFAAGHNAPVRRTVGRPSSETSDSIGRSVLAAGFDRETYNNMVSGVRLLDNEQCGIGIAMLRAIDGLPADQADNFTAFMANSVAAKGFKP